MGSNSPIQESGDEETHSRVLVQSQFNLETLMRVTPRPPLQDSRPHATCYRLARWKYAVACICSIALVMLLGMSSLGEETTRRRLTELLIGEPVIINFTKGYRCGHEDLHRTKEWRTKANSQGKKHNWYCCTFLRYTDTRQ